jgi:hypothetical protein
LSTATLELPREFACIDLMDGLDAEELSEVLAEVVSTMWSSGGGPDLRVLDAELFGAVLDRLIEPPTLSRLAAGSKVLRRICDASSEGPLTPAEIANRFVSEHGDRTAGSAAQRGVEVPPTPRCAVIWCAGQGWIW